MSKEKLHIKGDIELGIELMPDTPIKEAIRIVQVAEDLGYRYCITTDEGFSQDVYILLGALAQQTKTIKLGPVTNGYTRHPAVTAAALASLQDISEGRALLTFVAGGLMTLKPMGIQRKAPVTVVRESIEIVRLLWSGEIVSWKGEEFKLDHAQLAMGVQQIPIWIAARGDNMLELAGEISDGVILMGKSDLPSATSLVEKGSSKRVEKPIRAYLDHILYSSEMILNAKVLLTHMLIDTPPRMRENMGIDNKSYTRIVHAMDSRGDQEAAKLISDDTIRRLQIVGSLDECSQILRSLIREYELDIFLLDIVSSKINENVKLLTDTADIFYSDLHKNVQI